MVRRPPYHRDGRGRLQVKMTPMIDVIFLLLIFFVCTANFQAIEEVLPTNLSLPGSIESDAPVDPLERDLDDVKVRILWRDGRVHWQINQRDYDRLGDVHAVLAGIARLKSDLPVILDPDGQVPMENLIDVYDLCLAVGLEKVQVAASVEE